MAKVSSVYSPPDSIGKRKLIFGLEWWKWLSIGLVLYTIVMGFLGQVPKLPILHETIRNLYFHVPMWWGMMVILLVSLIYSIKYLNSGNTKHDIIACEAVNVGLLLGMLGLATGSWWAKFTWSYTPLLSADGWWVNDVRLNGAAITVLIYFAYVVLRNSMDEEQKRAKIAAVYSIFAYVMLIVFLMILPRLTDSLHPGTGGNPAFGKYDLDNNMRQVFYPAIIGWTLLAVWMMDILVRLRVIKQKILINQFK